MCVCVCMYVCMHVCVYICVCGWAPEGEGVLDRTAPVVRRSVEEDLCLK